MAIMKKGECIMNQSIIKIGGTVLTLAGMAISLGSSWLDDKKLDIKIAEKVAEALAKEK